MKFRTLDSTHDWTFGKGLNCYSKDEAATKLNIKTRILSWLNDCFFAMSEGIDWGNRLGLTGQRLLLEADVKRIILQTPDVVELVSFSSDVLNRDLQMNYSIKTIFGGVITDVVYGRRTSTSVNVLTLDDGSILEVNGQPLELS